MMNIAIYYVITVLYFLVGYLICIGSISTIEKDKVLYDLYKQLSTGFKTILFLLFVLFWLPILIGELFLIVLNWFSKNYNDL
jgi:hypothetical protein